MENLDLIIEKAVQKNYRKELEHVFHNNLHYFLKQDNSSWYVECYDFEFDFIWCLQYFNYFDALNCFTFEVTR